MMHPSKVPGLDGFNPLFFSSFWDILGKDVCRVMLKVWNGGQMSGRLSDTDMVLISKTDHPTNMAKSSIN